MEQIANVTNAPVENQEYLQVLKYEVGQYYVSHNDYIPDHRHMPCGPRVCEEMCSVVQPSTMTYVTTSRNMTHMAYVTPSWHMTHMTCVTPARHMTHMAYATPSNHGTHGTMLDEVGV
jgi:hypothetical protein